MRRIIILFALVFSITASAQETIFPAKFTAPAEFNTGKVHISVLSRSEHQMTTNFLFERGSHNSWHYHPEATQVLMVLNGEAFYQEEGKPKQLLRKGDVVTTAPNVRHWNGATPDSDCECMTVSDLIPGEEHAVQLRKVTDEEFSAPIKCDTAVANSSLFTLRSSLMLVRLAVHAGFYATLNGKYNADIWQIAEIFAAGEEKGEEQVGQFAQAFRAAGMNEAADEMEVFAKQEGHHGATLRAMIEKYRK